MAYSRPSPSLLSGNASSLMPPRTFPEPKADPPPPTHPKEEQYEWTCIIHEWVSTPPVALGMTSAREAAYLKHWRHRTMTVECAEGEQHVHVERAE